ncbi:colicin immunity protein [Microvirgula aerodenitrificans]|uniref:Colicin immunity protein n=1 Tax=Microvirgula aerodenitrificans TaxID=57480 RepID=A0A2S0P9F3_9NEIS|nr:colicin immunity domain-containing protein [Microvirgula aerodenitrificans]AVY93971.1 colicin immunity protein [Microvirgula aerodenitrificans]
MSATLLDLAKSFVDGEISASDFSDIYINLWRVERDSGIILNDEPHLSECLSSIFCAADMYCADDETREVYEFNDSQLKNEILSIIDRCL